jgi:hypothetical protein
MPVPGGGKIWRQDGLFGVIGDLDPWLNHLPREKVGFFELNFDHYPFRG